MMTAFEQTAALNAAIGVDLFTAIAEGAHTVAGLAQRCGCAERGVRILADVLTVQGLLAKVGGAYELAPDAAMFLVTRSPRYIGAAARFLASPEKIDLYFSDPPGWVRRGGPVGQANVAPQSHIWVEFARGMANLMAPTAIATADRLARLIPVPGELRQVLDVAAGHGLFGIEVAKRFDACQVTALDWAPVLHVARDNAQAAGIEARYTTIAGSAFDVDLGGPYDLVLAPNFLHHFSPPACKAMLQRLRAALSHDGALVIVEYCPDENRAAPAIPAWFALSMLTGTPSGDAYTAAELVASCIESGFASVEVEALPATAQTLLFAR